MFSKKTVLHFNDVGGPAFRIRDLQIRERECCVLFAVGNRLQQPLVRMATGVSAGLDSGSISLLGTNAEECDEAAWFELVEQIAIFDPASSLRETASIGENLAFSLLTKEPPVQEPELSRRILRMSNLLQLTIAQLASGVQNADEILRLKARLGRILCRNPRILFVQTENLTGECLDALPRLLNRARRKLKLTVVVFASNQALIEKIADRVIFLDPETGNFIENKLRGWYHKLLRFLPPTQARQLKLAAEIAEYSLGGTTRGPGEN